MFGGRSVEHDVSIASMNQVIKSVDIKKYSYYLIYISKDNHFYISDEFEELNNFKKEIKHKKEIIFYKTKNNKLRIKGLYFPLPSFYNQDIDAVIGVVHGKNVEDGTLSGYLKMLDAPYAMCDIGSASICQDKIYTKKVLESENINVVKYTYFRSSDWFNNRSSILVKCEDIGYPLIVKPSTLGSSIGIKKVNNKSELIEAIVNAINFDERVIVEKCINSFRELNCACLGYLNHYIISSVEEIKTKGDILTFDDKYIKESFRDIPADITNDLQKEIEDTTKKIVDLLCCKGVIRVDYIYDEIDNILYVNEVNSIPGSLSYNLFETKKIYMHDIIDELFSIAINSLYDYNKKIDKYSSNILNVNYLDK